MNFETNERRQERRQKTFAVVVAIISIIWILSRVAVASDLPDWASVDHRTQGGGWIWHPGKHLAPTIVEADAVAKGQAISALMEECQIPHSEIRFHERFVEHVGSKFRVHVRASIKDKHCREGKYGTARLKKLVTSKNLFGLYRKYKLKLAEVEVADALCNADSVACLDVAINAFNMGAPYKAYMYAENSCNHGMVEGCKARAIIQTYLRTNNL